MIAAQNCKRIQSHDSEIRKSISESQSGFTLVELLITLSVLSLLTVTMVTVVLGSDNKRNRAAYDQECEKILFTVLEYQNEAIMDGYRRQVRFLNGGMQVSWTKDRVNHKIYVPVTHLTFSGDFTGSAVLNLYEHGTVSQGGTLYLTGSDGTVTRMVVQVGNGRIYLDEP